MTDKAGLMDRVCRLKPGWRGEDLGAFSYLPMGYSNDNYAFRHLDERYVLRLPIGTRPRSEWRTERAFYQTPGDVAIPQVVAYDVDTGAMISRWIDGPLMADAPPEPKALVSFLRTLQKNLVASDRVYDPIERARRYLATKGPNLPSTLVSHLASALKWPRTGLKACHNDFNPWNVICPADGVWVTLDWESHGDNDPLFDLVTMHQGLEFDDEALPGMCEELLGVSVAAERVRQVLIGFWVREYAWAFCEWQQGNERDELRVQMRLAEARLMAIDGD